MTQQPEWEIPQFTRGDRLRKARGKLNMTTREFAEHIGVGQKTVTDAENDNREIRKPVLSAWALATGVPVFWLETGMAPGTGNGPEGQKLPRLDSNQQPSGISSCPVDIGDVAHAAASNNAA